MPPGLRVAQGPSCVYLEGFVWRFCLESTGRELLGGLHRREKALQRMGVVGTHGSNFLPVNFNAARDAGLAVVGVLGIDKDLVKGLPLRQCEFLRVGQLLPLCFFTYFVAVASRHVGRDQSNVLVTAHLHLDDAARGRCSTRGVDTVEDRARSARGTRGQCKTEHGQRCANEQRFPSAAEAFFPSSHFLIMARKKQYIKGGYSGADRNSDLGEQKGVGPPAVCRWTHTLWILLCGLCLRRALNFVCGG